jgi:2-amino-4-hydroxy-6-hydroxymethyldihydropteridine diphosphokinase
MIDCLIALGGNVGSVAETFDRAVERLNSEPQVVVNRMSRLLQTAPVGNDAGGRFWNAALALTTSLPALALLDRLLAIEDHFGRTRDRQWGPRTLDLDLLFYGHEVIDHPRLQVPHPACWYRRFVLDPLVEIARDVVHPVKGATIGELHARLLSRPLSLALAGRTFLERRAIALALQREFADIEFTNLSVERSSFPLEPTLIGWLGYSGTPQEEPRIAFADLPIVPRLDVSHAGDATAFLRDVLRSALG